MVEENKIYKAVPQTYGEAVQQYPWLEEMVEPHEWDNRTTAANAVWLIGHLDALKRGATLGTS